MSTIKRNRTRRNRGMKNAATRGGTPGTALGDAIVTLPLLGDKYEERRMLYYHERAQLTGALGALDTHYFRANDVYDPDQTGAGHQPIGFDQAMLFWEQFCVFSAKISVTFFSNSAEIVRVGVFLNPDTTNPSVGQIMEGGYMKTAIVTGSSTNANFHQIKQINMTCDNIKFFQSKNKEHYFDRDVFSGTAAASPAELAYFGVFAFGSGVAYEVYFDAEISYDVRFWEPRKLAQSLLHDALRLAIRDEREESKDGVMVATDSDDPKNTPSPVSQVIVRVPIKGKSAQTKPVIKCK